MKLLNTYEDRDQSEEAERKISGKTRLASERDGTVTIYNLFGQASWGNFYKLGMFDLPQLKEIVDKKLGGKPFDKKKHREIIGRLKYTATSFELEIPGHWL